MAIHGDKAQEERERSIDAFKRGEKDVLVATDVASKVCGHNAHLRLLLTTRFHPIV